jgi:hypothetical protein
MEIDGFRGQLITLTTLATTPPEQCGTGRSTGVPG